MNKPKIAFPRACRLLRDIDEAGFGRLCECLHARELHLLNKETFVFDGDPCDKIGIVVSGSVQLSRRRMDGGRLVMENVPANDVFGTTYAFRDVNTAGISMSAVGATMVLLFDTRNITRPCHEVCDAHMQFVRNLLAVMSQKTYQMKQKLRILSQRTIGARVMHFLHVCARHAKAKEFDIAFDRQSLADYLCVDRCALSSALSKLQRAGKLTFEKNHFVLLGR